LQLPAILNLVSMPQTAVTQITEDKSYTGIGVTHQDISLICPLAYPLSTSQ